MKWLNYHHLLYFWVVAKEGSIAAASERLHLAQPTLSSQIKKLETSLGLKLFDRRGRNLALTEAGQTAYRYADEIFTLGREMSDALSGKLGDKGLRLSIGMPDVLPKLVVFHLLEPALAMDENVRLEIYEGKLDELLVDLATYRLDVVISETPLQPNANIKAFNHLLGETTLTCYGTAALARKYSRRFPKSLDGAPMLLPTQNTVMRRGIEQWLDDQSLRPVVKHEFEDSALLKVFGKTGAGLFFASSAIERDICEQYSVKALGRIDVKERFYAISVERRVRHPAVAAICKVARDKLFVD